jgi:uncharacterized membrane protein YdjX (TVP38/TMEM64 family)
MADDFFDLRKEKLDVAAFRFARRKYRNDQCDTTLHRFLRITSWRLTMKAKLMVVKKSRLVKGGLVLLVILAAIYWWNDLKTLFALVSDRDLIVAYLQQYGPLGPVVLFSALMLQVFFAIIPGHAFIVAGGYIYGLVIGSLIALASTVIAAQLAFLLTRRFGRPLVDRLAPKKVVDYWYKMAQNQGGVFFAFSFILPIFPNDLMSFVAALGTISPKRFFFANFFGRLPCAIFITLIGSHGIEMPIQYWAMIGAVLLGLTLVWKRVTPTLEQRFLNRAQPVRVY